MPKKSCTTCGEIKTLDQFYKCAKGPDGRVWRCKECANAAHSKWVANNSDRNYLNARRLYEPIRELKEKTPCFDCGNYFPFYVMDYDHIDRLTKSFNVGKGIGNTSIERLMDEIAKCVLRCANCHRFKTAQEQIGKFKPLPEPVEETRFCKEKNHWVPANHFAMNRGKPFSTCIPCQREFKKPSGKWVWYKDLKENSPCMDCGVLYGAAAMEFDHRPGVQKMAGVSRMVRSSATKEEILLEIAKCDLICANCHRVRTYNRRDPKHQRIDASLHPPKTPKPEPMYTKISILELVTELKQFLIACDDSMLQGIHVS